MPVVVVRKRRNPLSVSMLADGSSAQAFMGTVEFKVTNNSGEVLKVPYWQLPGASLESKLFQVFHNGKAAQYLGPMIKRAAPTDVDMVTFQPYETKLISVDLSKSYDLSKTGDYTVSFVSYLEGAKTNSGRKLSGSNGRMASLQSVPLKLWVDADNLLKSLQPGVSTNAKPGTGGTVVNGVTYVSCSSTQITDAGAGVAQARLYTENAKGYLAGNNQTVRYTTWFGAYTSSRYATVNQHFVAIDADFARAYGIADGSIRPVDPAIAGLMMIAMISGVTELADWAPMAPESAPIIFARPFFEGLFCVPTQEGLLRRS